MKRKNPLSMLGAWLALGLASSQAVQAEDSRSGAASARQTGSVSGHVRNDTTGTYVAGATVAVKGTSKVVTTDQTGFFAIDNLPRGATTLVVSAFDLDTKNVPIEVTPGATAQVEVALSSNFYTLEAFNVTAAREGTARAINDQRNALNIVNVTATDAFGNLRDGNVAEMVARMPGVSVLHVANDIRHVMVRGIDSALGSVTMDGLQLAASEGGGMSRGFPWTQTSADNIETVIVTKAPTPDGDASAIGGSIDLKSKSAFDNRDQRRTEIRVGMNYETAKKLAFPIANFSHRQLFGTERRLGIALNLGYSQYNNVGSASVLGHVTTAAEGPTPLRQANFYDYPAISERFGSGVRIDYRVAGRTTVFTNFAYTSHTNSVRSPSVYRRFNLVAAANGTTVAPGFSDDYAQWNPVASSIARLQVGQYPQFVNSRNFSGGFDHRWGDWKLEGLASYSLAQTRYDMLSQGVAQLQAAVTGVGLILDRRNRDRYFPAITQVSGPDMYRLENYRAETLLLADQWGREKVHSARLDLQRRFGGSLDLTLKTGAKIKNQNRQVTNDNKTYAYAGPDGGLNSGDESLVRFLDQYYTRFDPGHPGYKAPQWFDNQAVARSFKETPSWWVENLNANTRTRLSGNQKINETVSAAYLQAVAKIGPLSVLTGVRVEETRDSATGTTQGISPAELARRAAYVGTLTNAEIVRRATAEYTRITKRASYTNAFPGLHLSYAIRPGLLARASYTE
ncbi:MAG: carboxypeptidase-like regulatory domain-containing protein, partial [Opitutaceae bacterium]